MMIDAADDVERGNDRIAEARDTVAPRRAASAAARRAPASVST